MAIDTRRKRASAAVLGLAFLGPSVVPDGTLVQADRQAIAHSYYGIAAASSFVEIGGTSQLGSITSSGGITLERAIGATSQIGVLSSSGGITVGNELSIGGTSQLESITSSGGITLERNIGGTSQVGAITSSGGITLERAIGGTNQIAAITSSGVIQVGDNVVPLGAGKKKKKILGLPTAEQVARKAKKKRDEQRADKEREALEQITSSTKLKEKLREFKAKGLTKGLTEDRLEAISQIDDDINRQLAIELALAQINDFKRREAEALALLLMVA